MRQRTYGLMGYALLGLLYDNPSSGYALRRVFALTPMSSFSDSPGAIYPALERLRKAGLIRGRQEKSSGMRRRQVFQLTPAGTRELKKWLTLPPNRDEIMRRMEEVLLRFAFMDQVLGTDASQRFLTSMERELASYIPTLHAYLQAAGHLMPLSARLAVESGIRGYETHLEWARGALSTYAKQK